MPARVRMHACTHAVCITALERVRLMCACTWLAPTLAFLRGETRPALGDSGVWGWGSDNTKRRRPVSAAYERPCSPSALPSAAPYLVRATRADPARCCPSVFDPKTHTCAAEPVRTSRAHVHAPDARALARLHTHARYLTAHSARTHSWCAMAAAGLQRGSSGAAAGQQRGSSGAAVGQQRGCESRSMPVSSPAPTLRAARVAALSCTHARTHACTRAARERTRRPTAERRPPPALRLAASAAPCTRTCARCGPSAPSSPYCQWQHVPPASARPDRRRGRQVAPRGPS